MTKPDRIFDFKVAAGTIRTFAYLLGFACLISLSLMVWGHTLPISTLTLAADEEYLHLELVLNPFELNFFAEVDANHNGTLDPLEQEAHGEQLTRRILENIKILAGDRLLVAEIAGLVDSSESHHLQLRAHYAHDARNGKVSLESSLSTITSGSHVTHVTFLDGDKKQSARLDTASRIANFKPLSNPASTHSIQNDSRAIKTELPQNKEKTELMLTLIMCTLLGSSLLFSLLACRKRIIENELSHTKPVVSQTT